MLKRFNYTDTIAQLYYEHGTPKGQLITRDITFQVTDACNAACRYCLSGNTKIRMADFSEKDIKDISVGDKILAFNEYMEPDSKGTRIYESTVTKIFHRKSNVIKITFDNGESIITTRNHPFLTRRDISGKYDYAPAERMVVGRNAFCLEYPQKEYFVKDENYMIGYLVGCILGDGSLKSYIYASRGKSPEYKFRIAVKDDEMIERCSEYFKYFDINFYMKKFKISTKYNLVKDAIFSNKKETFCNIKNLIDSNFRKNKSEGYYRGFLAGIYDAEGHLSKDAVIRICNTDENIISEICEGMSILGIPFIVEESRPTKNKPHKWNVRIAPNKRGVNSYIFMYKTDPAIARKSFIGLYGKNAITRCKVISVEELKDEIDVYNFSTDLHTYIANNIAVHNCYQHNKGSRMMSKETAKQAVDLLFDMYDKNEGTFINQYTKAIILDFIGGEPLLNIDVIDYTCTYFMEQCLKRNHPWIYTWRASMISNGAMYFDPRVQDFLKKFRGFVSFSITVDGPKEIHDACRIYHDGRGNFDDAYAALKHFNKNYHEILGTKVTIAPENLDQINKIVKFFVDEGMYQIHANPIFEEAWTVEHGQKYYIELKKMADYLLNLDKEVSVSLFQEFIGAPMKESDNQNWCGGNMNCLAFDPDGVAYPCLRYMESSLGDKISPIIIGDVNGLFATNEQKDIAKRLGQITRRSQSTDECFYCPIASGCAYCSAWNYEYFGEINKRCINICNMHKARVLANVYYWNNYYRKKGINKRYAMFLPKEEAIKFVEEKEYEMLLRLSKN